MAKTLWDEYFDLLHDYGRVCIWFAGSDSKWSQANVNEAYKKVDDFWQENCDGCKMDKMHKWHRATRDDRVGRIFGLRCQKMRLDHELEKAELKVSRAKFELKRLEREYDPSDWWWWCILY